jgi:hypothetical protein
MCTFHADVFFLYFLFIYLYFFLLVVSLYAMAKIKRKFITCALKWIVCRMFFFCWENTNKKKIHWNHFSGEQFYIEQFHGKCFMVFSFFQLLYGESFRENFVFHGVWFFKVAPMIWVVINMSENFFFMFCFILVVCCCA